MDSESCTVKVNTEVTEESVSGTPVAEATTQVETVEVAPVVIKPEVPVGAVDHGRKTPKDEKEDEKLEAEIETQHVRVRKQPGGGSSITFG